MFLKLHAHWRDGRLARPGGVLDQPAVYVAAMELIDAVAAEILADKTRQG